MLIGHSWADLNGTILQIDDAVADLLRRRRRDLEGISYLSITHPADRNRNAALVSALRPGAGPKLLRKRYLGDDGTEIWATLHTARVGKDNASSHLVGTFMADQPDNGPRRLWREATRLLDTYRLRAEVLGHQLFADHAWLIILHLYIAEAEGCAISISEISRQSRISERSLTLWVRALFTEGLIANTTGRAGVFELSQGGIAKVERLLDNLDIVRSDDRDRK